MEVVDFYRIAEGMMLRSINTPTISVQVLIKNVS